MSTSPDKPDPHVLQICTKCRLVYDDRSGWLSKKAYRGAIGIDPLTCRLTHTYCPLCYNYFVQKFQAA